MADILPPNPIMNKRDVFKTLVEYPLEAVTTSLRKGDAHDLTHLEPYIRRCRALVAAYDERVSQLEKVIE